MLVLFCLWDLNLKGGQLYPAPPLVIPGLARVALYCLWAPPGISPVTLSAIVTLCFDAVTGGCRGSVGGW